MKKILYIVPILLAALTSCQKEEELGDGTDAVTINATIGESSEGIPLTRVNSTEDDATKWDAGDQIAVSNGGEFVKYTYAGSDAWTAEAGKFLKWSSPTMTFNAYYPARNPTADMGNFVLSAVQSTAAHISTSDYMTYSGSNTKPASGSAVNLALTRKTARVILNVTFANEFGTTPAPSVGELYVNSAHGGYTSGVPAGDPLPVNPFRNSTVSENQFIALVIPSATYRDLEFIRLEIRYGESNSKSKYVFLRGIPVMGAGKSYTYNLIAGKDKLEVTNVTVEDWASGGVIPGGEAEAPIEVNPDTHTLTVLKPGFLTANHIATALGGGTELIVRGTLNADDVAKLAATTSLTAIDLRGVTYPAATRTVGTVPPADWSGCTNLRAILINTADAAAYKTAWSAASDKLLYLGKELVHKVDAMTDEYNKNGVPCVVIGITGFESHRLISRNPYCSNVDETKIGILGTSETTAGCVYSKLAAIIKPWGGKVSTLDDLKALLPLRPNSFTEVTKEENGNGYYSIQEINYYFVVDSDGSQYVKKYGYSNSTKEFTLGYQYTSVDIYSSDLLTFITFDVTNP